MEKPPNVTGSKNDISLSVEMQTTGEMKLIQDEYLYWDKLKYKTSREGKEEVWSAVK